MGSARKSKKPYGKCEKSRFWYRTRYRVRIYTHLDPHLQPSSASKRVNIDVYAAGHDVSRSGNIDMYVGNPCVCQQTMCGTAGLAVLMCMQANQKVANLYSTSYRDVTCYPNRPADHVDTVAGAAASSDHTCSSSNQHQSKPVKGTVRTLVTS